MLILIYHAVPNSMLDENWEMSANVIHFLSFAGMLPITFKIFSLSSNFLKGICQKRNLPIKMTGMVGLAIALVRNQSIARLFLS